MKKPIIYVALFTALASSQARAEIDFLSALTAVIQGSKEVFGGQMMPQFDKLNGLINDMMSMLGYSGTFGKDQTSGQLQIPHDGGAGIDMQEAETQAAVSACQSNPKCNPGQLAVKVEAIKQKYEGYARKNINGGMVISDKELAQVMENDAYAVNDSHARASSAGAQSLDPKNKTINDDDLVARVYRESGTSPASPDLAKISSYLTPTRMVFPAVDPNYQKGSILLNEDQARTLTDVLMGTTSTALLTPNQLKNANGASIQGVLFTRFARLQMARVNIESLYNKSVILSLQDHYKKYVASPTGDEMQNKQLSDQQWMSVIARLLQGTNLQLLMVRRQLYEMNALNATILTATIEGQRSNLVDQSVINAREVVVP